MRHPQLTKRRLLAAAVVLALAATGFWLFGGSDAATTVTTKEVTATRGDIDVYIESDGIVSAEKANLSFSQAGMLETLNVKVGDTVASGDVLATLDASKSQYQVDQASSAYSAALAKAARVKPGSGGEEIVAKRVAVQAAQAALSAERAIYDDVVAKNGVGSSQELAEYAKLKKAESDVSSAQAQLDLTSATYTDANYAASSALANLHVAQTTLGETTLRAPIDGVVTTVNGSLGQYLAASQQATTAFITVSKVDTLTIISFLDEEDVSRVTVGQSVKAEFTALDKTLEGTVAYVSPVAKTDANGAVSYEARITLNEPGTTVRDGMSANLRFITKSVGNVIKVPNKAVKLQDGTSYVEQYDAAGKVQRKDVTTGFTDGQYVEITSGLQSGDKCIVTTATTATSST